MTNDMNRREFVSSVAGAAAACYMCACGVSSALAADAAPVPATVDAGPVSAFAKDGLYDQQLKDNKIIIYSSKGRVYASTAACTHRKVLLKIVDGQARCPAHGSRFDTDGKPLKGPANKPLARFAVSIDADKHLIIDTTKTFDEPQWNDASASVATA